MRAVAALGALVVLAACAGRPVVPTPYWDHPDPDTLLSGALLGASPALPDTPPVSEILALDASMRAFAQRFRGMDLQRERHSAVERLIATLADDDAFRIRYDPDLTLTARETFATGAGNCLAFANLVVALARASGAKAHYRLVDIPQVTEQHQDLLLVYRHINVELRTRDGRSYVVDLDGRFARSPHPHRLLEDEQAFALYYTNLAASALLENDALQALALLRAAIQTHAGLAAPWVNLGVLYRRVGQLAAAEAAYLHALERDGRDRSARYNLASLYTQAGMDSRAQALRSQLAREDSRNPYASYERGLVALQAGQPEQARQAFAAAVQRAPRVAHFHAGLARAEHALGRNAVAQQHLLSALKIGADGQTVREWRGLLRKLQPPATPPPAP